jgi:glycosyltransferase involved in cell wall biosynthesis
MNTSRQSSTKKKRKILITIPCLLRGGTEMQTLLLSRVLIESGYDVQVICYFESDESVVSEFNVISATVTLLQWSRTIGKAKFIRLLSRIFKEISPDVVHVQYMAPGLLPIIAARLAGVPRILATVHQPGTPHGLKEKLFLRFASKVTNHFICVSEAVEKSWFGNSCLLGKLDSDKTNSRKHFTIPNAVDIERLNFALGTVLSKVTELIADLNGNKVIGTVARLSNEKGIDILLKAFALVQKEFHHTKLLIVGDGSQSADLKELVNQLDISNSIVWMGQLSWQEAMRCIGLMDVVAVPSRFEGFGLTAVEAMACAKPVVASRVDGLAEVINDGETGILVPPENPARLASALVTLLKDKERRQEIGAAAREHVAENYTYSKFSERCRTLYKSFDLLV